MTWFLIIVAVIIIAILVILFLNRYYRKATREVALVRTGAGGLLAPLDGLQGGGVSVRGHDRLIAVHDVLADLLRRDEVTVRPRRERAPLERLIERVGEGAVPDHDPHLALGLLPHRIPTLGVHDHAREAVGERPV